VKQNDLIVLIVSVFISIFVSVLASKLIFSSPTNLNQKVYVVPSISTNFTQPSSSYFNAQAIDPTQLINIAPSNNQQPFNGKAN